MNSARAAHSVPHRIRTVCLAAAVCILAGRAGVCYAWQGSGSSLKADHLTAEPGVREDALDNAHSLYLLLAQSLSPQHGYPRSILDGSDWHQVPPYQWTGGFFPGILWQLCDYGDSEELLEQAQRWTVGLEEQATQPSHDAGIMINSSFGRGYRITGDEWYRDVTLEAADHLATRFSPTVGAIRSWGNMERFSYPVIVDNMISLEILYWAARNGGDESLAEIATTHAMTTMRDHVRDDGTTFHVVDYEQATGEVIWRGTVQGLADTSVWARGQAWALYGFTMAYRESREPAFLTTACRVADAFLERLPEDVIPCWDFDAAATPGQPKDASAAAIAASGLWDLSLLVDADAARYRDASIALVDGLSSDDYSATLVGLPALLLHSTGNMPRNSEVDVPLIYAEYYYIEALMKQTLGADTWCSKPSLSSFPNPFSAETQLLCGLTSPADVTLQLYDLSGRPLIALSVPGVGDGSARSVSWDGCDAEGRAMPSGVYFARLATGGASAFHKVVLLR